MSRDCSCIVSNRIGKVFSHAYSIVTMLASDLCLSAKLKIVTKNLRIILKPMHITTINIMRHW